MDQPRVERLLRLMRYLIGNKLTTNELAEKLECSVRTIQRYIDTLKSAGFVIEYRDRGIPFMSTQKGSLKDITDLVHFSEEEAYILLRAIDSIDANNAIKHNLKKKLYNIYNYPWLADLIVRPEEGRNVQNLIKAIQEKKFVILKNYRSSSSKKISDRKVEPYKFTINYEQIWCYDPSDGICKTFRVSRIGKVEITDETWKYEKEHKETYIDIFRCSNTEYIGTAVLTLNLRAFNLLVEEFPLAEKYTKQISDNEYKLEAPICKYEGATRFILGLIDCIEIEGDKNLKRFVKDKIKMIKNF